MVQASMGHNRMPTSGGRGDAQAQPFSRRKLGIVVVHNGWVFDSVDLAKKEGIKKTAGVDSEIFVAYIAKHGIAALPKLLGTFSGAAALGILVNQELYLCRKDNPLVYTFGTHPNGTNGMMFASTAAMLSAGAQGHAHYVPEGHILKYNKATNEMDKVAEFTTGIRYFRQRKPWPVNGEWANRRWNYVTQDWEYPHTVADLSKIPDNDKGDNKPQQLHAWDDDYGYLHHGGFRLQTDRKGRAIGFYRPEEAKPKIVKLLPLPADKKGKRKRKAGEASLASQRAQADADGIGGVE
jgi:hypothetical protein